jgi:mono/diheme cytochrome c family protein
MSRGTLIWGAVLAATATATAASEPPISWKLLPGAPASANTSTLATERGQRAFENACAVCHAAGDDRPGTSSLGFKYKGRLPALLEQRTDLTPDVVRYFIRTGVAMMPQFRKTELADEQVADISAYLTRNRKAPRR